MAERKKGPGASFSETLSESQRRRMMETMLNSVIEMGMSGENSDVDIIVEGHPYPCHKILLAAGSPYFKSMFASGMMESTSNRLELPDIDRKTFEAFKKYIYTQDVNIDQDNVMDLLKASSIFQVLPLQEQCEAFLSTEMDAENCLELFKIARCMGCKVLLEKCRPFVMEGFNGLWKSEEFQLLEFDDIQSIVKDDELVPVDEEQIAEAVLRWIKKDEKDRKQYLSKLFMHIRLINISPEYLIDVLFQEELCINDDKCENYLCEARDYHMLPARQQEFCTPRFHLRHSDDFEEVILVLTEFDMDRSGSFYQDGKCLWAYSYQQNRWYTLAPINLQENPGNEFAVISYRNDLYLSGGQNGFKHMLRYDSTSNEWSNSDTQMKRGRASHMMAAVRNSIYVLGGINPKAKSENNVLSSVEEYSIPGRKWRTASELCTPVHSASTAVLGEKIYIMGGIQQDGTLCDAVQVFDTRHRECKIVGQLPPDLTQPLQFVHLNRQVILVNSTGDIYRFKDKPKIEFKKFTRVCSTTLPILGFTHFRGNIIILSGMKDRPDCYSKMTKIDTKSSPARITEVIPKVNTKPKPIHACLRGIVNKQFLYHTYFQ